MKIIVNNVKNTKHNQNRQIPAFINNTLKYNKFKYSKRLTKPVFETVASYNFINTIVK